MPAGGGRQRRYAAKLRRSGGIAGGGAAPGMFGRLRALLRRCLVAVLGWLGKPGNGRATIHGTGGGHPGWELLPATEEGAAPGAGEGAAGAGRGAASDTPAGDGGQDLGGGCSPGDRCCGFLHLHFV